MWKLGQEHHFVYNMSREAATDLEKALDKPTPRPRVLAPLSPGLLEVEQPHVTSVVTDAPVPSGASWDGDSQPSTPDTTDQVSLVDEGQVKPSWQEVLASSEAIAGLVVLTVVGIGALISWYLVWSGRCCRNRRFCAGAAPAPADDAEAAAPAGEPSQRLCAPCRLCRRVLAACLAALRLLFGFVRGLC